MTRPIKSELAALKFSNQEELWDWYDGLITAGVEVVGQSRDALLALCRQRHVYPSSFPQDARFDVAVNAAGWQAVRVLARDGAPRFVLNKMRLTSASHKRLEKPEARMREAITGVCDQVVDVAGYHAAYWEREPVQAHCQLTGLALSREFSKAIPSEGAWSAWKLSKWCAQQFQTPPVSYFQHCESEDRSEFTPAVRDEVTPFIRQQSVAKCGLRIVHVLGELLARSVKPADD